MSSFYMHTSDVLRSSLVSLLFDGTGYGSWRRTILMALSVRNKLDFINGSSVKPLNISPLARQWQRCNDLVVSWLTNSLSKDITRSVEYSELAKDIWSELEERYGHADAAKVFELKKDLAHISQGSLDIASYFNKIKKLWDEIDSLSISRVRSCSNCGFKSDYQKDDDVQKVYQFLMGLNDVYVQTRSNIFMIKPFSSVNTVFSILLLSDEKQRHVSTSPRFLPTSVSFNARVSKQGFPSRINFDAQRPLTCKYCKKPGHTLDKCYKLHGYPPNFKFTKGPDSRKTTAHVEVNSPGPLANVDSNMGPDSV
ncbi:uncharacterized protein [Nicotiana tomentosiformis]|uniref:uncharacterized protein n=1 Tax=Nicotiana tomentosiformis TaxID=4098 RepID=UPI00051C9587|nr:uncharacterized protein LOC104090502 [Nicotiana tomentosiformis]